MRKIQQEEVFFAVAELTEIGTAEVDIFFDCRMLFKLP